MGRFDKIELPNNRMQDETQQSSSQEIYTADRFISLAEENYWEGNYEESLRYYSKALGEDSGIIPAWIGQVQCLIRLKEFNEALMWVDKALDKFPDTPHLLALKAVALIHLDQKSQALGFIDAATGSRVDSPEIWISRGEVFLKTNLQNAGRCFLKALEKDPDNWKLLAAIGDAYCCAKFFHKALPSYLKAIVSKTDNARLWLMIGICRRELGMKNYKEALQHALELRPNWKIAQEALRKKSAKFLTAKIKSWINAMFIR